MSHHLWSLHQSLKLFLCQSVRPQERRLPYLHVFIQMPQHRQQVLCSPSSLITCFPVEPAVFSSPWCRAIPMILCATARLVQVSLSLLEFQVLSVEHLPRCQHQDHLWWLQQVCKKEQERLASRGHQGFLHRNSKAKVSWLAVGIPSY